MTVNERHQHSRILYTDEDGFWIIYCPECWLTLIYGWKE